MSPGRVLYLTYDGLLEPLGRSQVVPVVRGLAARGFSMEILSFEKPGDLASPAAVSRIRQELAEAGVGWRPRPYHARPSVPATAYDIWRGSREVRRFLREAEGEVVLHARSYVPALMGLRGRKGLRHGSPGPGLGPKLLFDMRGFWVDERLEAGRWRAGTAVVKLARRTEARLLREADWLVHLSRAGMENVPCLAPGSKLPPSSVISTSVNMDRFRPAGDRRAFRRTLGLGAGPLIIHTGTLSGWYLGTETFQLGKLLMEKTGGEFVVLTREVELAEALSRKERVRAHIRTVPFEDMPSWLGAADVGLCLVRPGFAKTASAPTKIGEYLAAGLVVVATRGVGDLEDQFSGSPVALAVDPHRDPEATACRVLEALAREGRVQEARDLAARHYDLNDAIASYQDIYGELGVSP